MPTEFVPQSVTANTSIPFRAGGQPVGNMFNSGITGRLFQGGKALYGLASGNPKAMLGGALGLLGMHKSGKAAKLVNHDFDYGHKTSQYDQNQQMNASMSKMGGLGDEFSQSYRQMLNPGSQYNNRLFQNLRQNVADTGNQTVNQMNNAMASRGMTGMGGVFDAIQNRAGGEAYSQGMQGIMNQSAQQAGQFGQLGLGAYQQAGGLASQADARALQNNQFNAGSENQYEQFLAESNYNQDMNNANTLNNMNAQQGAGLMGMAGNILGSLFNKQAPMAPNGGVIKNYT